MSSELIQKVEGINMRVSELEAAFNSWKDNNGTIVVEKIVESIKEVPVEVIREVEKIVAPDTSELEAKLGSLSDKLGAITGGLAALTSVAPVMEKLEAVVADAIIDTNEAPAPSPATDAFIETEPAILEPVAVPSEELTPPSDPTVSQ